MANKVFILISALFLVGCVSAKPKMETYMGRAVYDVSIATPPNEVVRNVYESISLRSNQLAKTVTFMPPSLPERPGTPTIGIKSFGLGVATFGLPQTTCDGAYALMNGLDKGVSSSAYGTSDYASYTSCIYPYKDAFRVYLIGNFISSSSGGIQGVMAETIKKGVSGAANYDNIYAAWFDSIIKKFKEKIPDAKEIEVSLPQM